MSHRRLRVLPGALLLIAAADWSCGGEPDVAAPAAAPAGGEPAAEAAGAAELPPLDPATFGALAGTVRFEGKVPVVEPANASSLPECHKYGGTSIAREDYLIQDGRVANVYVYVRRGLRKDLEFPPAGETVVIDQKGCRFLPHAVAVRIGQPIQFLNNDPGLHNAKLVGKLNDTVNIGITEGQSKTVVLKRGNEIIKVDCDVHPFMRSYIGVFEHPFFALTGADGTFRIEGLPPGEYGLKAVHERLGELEQTVVVPPSGTANLEFVFKN